MDEREPPTRAALAIPLLLLAAVARAAPQDDPIVDAAPEDSFVAVSGREAVLAPVATIEHPELDENSGLARLGGLWFTHNDSGDEARLFAATDPSFRSAQPLPLPGAAAVDWEAITVLGGELIVCDVGDNFRARADATVYRARYVPARDGGKAPARLELVASCPVGFPDGAHDCEAAFALDGKLHLIVKNRGEPTTDVFRFDTLEDVRELPAGRRNLGVKVGSLEIPPGEQVTDAALHAASGKLVLVTYSQLLVYPQGRLSGAPERVVTLHAQQCEALAFAGDDLFMTNEQREVFRFARFLEREVDWALPDLPSYTIELLPQPVPGLAGELPSEETPLQAIHLKHGTHDERLRIGYTADRLFVEGVFTFEGAHVVTRQDSPRLGTSVLLFFPRGRALQYGAQDLQLAVIVREDGAATLLRLPGGGAQTRPELVPEARIRGAVSKGRLSFVLSLPLDFALGSPVPASFRFNAMGFGLGAEREPIVSGYNRYSMIRPFMAATVRLVAPAAGDHEEDE